MTVLGNKLSPSLLLNIWEHMDPCHCRQPFKSSVIGIWIESASFERTYKFLPVQWMELYILPYTNKISNCIPDQANWVGFQCKVTVIKAFWKKKRCLYGCTSDGQVSGLMPTAFVLTSVSDIWWLVGMRRYWIYFSTARAKIELCFRVSTTIVSVH